LGGSKILRKLAALALPAVSNGAKALLVALLFSAPFVCSAIAKVPQNNKERDDALKALSWTDGQTLSLPKSRGTLKTPKDIDQLLGIDASSLWEILNGVEAPPGTEAVIYESKTETLVFFQRLGDGYVSLDDWDDVDADAMLKSVSENTEAANAKRQGTGLAPLHVVGWLERPHLDRSTNTVRWAFEAKSDDGALVNSIALVLARDGFEKLTWIGPKAAVNDGLLKIAQGGFNFPSGGRYTDYVAGDKVAEYGIAGLVAAVLGAKTIAKLGILAAIAVFAKKFAVLLLLPFSALVVWLRRLFSIRKAPPS
jgi:uncharacterized membrane-anchored protein